MQSQAGEPAGAAPRAELSLCQKLGVQTGGGWEQSPALPSLVPAPGWAPAPGGGHGAAVGLFSGQLWGTGLVHHAQPWRCWSRVPVQVHARGLYMPCMGARVPARCKVARSGLLLCRGHKGKCWVQQLGTGPGRGFQRGAGCDDGAAAQTLMSSHFLCAPARGLPLPGYKVGAPLHPETQARSLQQEAAAAQVRGPSARAAALAPAGPEGGREKHRGSSVPSTVPLLGAPRARHRAPARRHPLWGLLDNPKPRCHHQGAPGRSTHKGWCVLPAPRTPVRDSPGAGSGPGEGREWERGAQGTPAQ